MTQHDGFDRTLSAWLDEQAGHGTPTYLGDVLARTIRTRQRPAWSSLERWLPVQMTFSGRLAPIPRQALKRPCHASRVKRPAAPPCRLLLPDLGTLLIVPPAARLSAIPPPVSTTVCATTALLVM